MLSLLEVRNMALIDNLSFYPGKGLNVISGETGAGKSMLLGAVDLILGNRANPEIVRTGEESAHIFAVFSDCGKIFANMPMLENDGDELILSREIRRNGPNICRINERVQPLTLISAIAQQVLDLHSQNQQQSLHSNQTQRQLLDAYGSNMLAAEYLSEVNSLYTERCRLQKILDEIGSDDVSLARKVDFMRFQLEEIKEANLSADEEEKLELSLKRLTHARQLTERTSRIFAEIYEGIGESSIVDRLGMVEKELSAATALDESLSQVQDQVQEASGLIAEAARYLRDYQDTISHDETLLSEVSERLEQYRNLKKKYGPAIADVNNFAQNLEFELEDILGHKQLIAETSSKLEDINGALKHASINLSKARRSVADELEKKIQQALQGLALQDARFVIQIEDSGQLGRYGHDKVEYLFSANPGEAEMPLNKVASGGEVARLMLAVKSVLAEQNSVPTLIFDEIDAGIGGVTVGTVADKLKALAKYCQVICVTHQPLIAAAADHHFLIYKEKKDGRTITRLIDLSEKEREMELTRMLGGKDGDEIALEHARQLRQKN